MNYLRNIPDAQVLMIPRNGEVVSGDMTLILRDTTDHQEIIIPVIDLNTSGLYYNLAIDLPEGIASGEYQYKLKKEEIIMSNGLLYIGNEKSPYQYGATIKYKQYGSD